MSTDGEATASQDGGGTPEDEEVLASFRETVEEGTVRLGRTLSGLLATGFIGGVEVGLGVLALLVVEHLTHSPLLAGLAFSVGFIALTLGRSELFTENFLVPVATVVAHRASVWSLLRLWAGTGASNLAGGWIIAAVIVMALPEAGATAVELAAEYNGLGLGLESFGLGILGGAVITVMTWMERGSDSEFGKVVSAVVAAFLLGAGSLNHVIVVSLLFFAALAAGAPFGYLDWLGFAAWATLANMTGGLLLVTVMRLVQVGVREVGEQRQRPGGVGANRDAQRAGTGG
ncbi:formate/nitrite transporter family protein [soil metagenome]